MTDPDQHRSLNGRTQSILQIIVGSYFMALSLDFVAGVDQTILFSGMMSGPHADLVGSTLLLALSSAFMTGWGTRITAPALAGFVFLSSLAQNFLHFEPGNISYFWRDVTLLCAVLLSSSWFRQTARPVATVQPRRVHLTPRRAGQAALRLSATDMAQQPVQPHCPVTQRQIPSGDIPL